MTKVINTKNGVLRFDKKTVTKEISKDKESWSKDLYDLYQLFSAQHSYTTKLISRTNDRIYVMERLDIVADLYDILNDPGPHKLATLENCLKIVLFYNKLYVDCLEFSIKHLPQGKYFFHIDPSYRNVVFTSDGSIKLIDFNSFKIENNFLNAEHKGFSQYVLHKTLVLSERIRLKRKYGKK
jgi:thiamine kinase-like enzyme